MSNTIPHWKFFRISNMDKVLGPFARQNCFAHVTNFQEIDLSPTSHPIVLRSRPVGLLMLREINGTLYLLHYQKGASGLLVKKIPLLPTYMINCPLYLAMTRDPDYELNCVKLAFVEFVTQVRPWNCQIHVGIFPSNYLMRNELLSSSNILTHYGYTYPLVWFYSEYLELSDKFYTVASRVLPSSTPSFHLLIVNEKLHKNYMQGSGYAAWVRHLSAHYGILQEKISHDIFLVGFAEVTKTARKNALGLEDSSVMFVKVLRADLHGTLDDIDTVKPELAFLLNIILFLNDKWQFSELKEFWKSNDLAASTGQQPHWTIEQKFVNQQNRASEKKGRKYFIRCEAHSRSYFTEMYNPTVSIQDRLPKVLVHFWVSIMGNFSYNVKDNEYKVLIKV